MIQNRILAISTLAILAVAVLSTGAIHEASARGGVGGGGQLTVIKADLRSDSGSTIKAKGDYREDATTQKFKVNISAAPVNTTYKVIVNGNTFGSITTDVTGNGSLDLVTVQVYYGEGLNMYHVQLGDTLQIYEGTTLVLSGNYVA